MAFSDFVKMKINCVFFGFEILSSPTSSDIG